MLTLHMHHNFESNAVSKALHIPKITWEKVMHSNALPLPHVWSKHRLKFAALLTGNGDSCQMAEKLFMWL
jgi:hypothetical protein